jgi:hypothetical protein
MRPVWRPAVGLIGAMAVLAVLIIPMLTTSRPIGLAPLQPGVPGAAQVRLDQHPLLDGVVMEQDIRPNQDGLSEVDVYVNSWGHPTLAPLRLDILDAGGRDLRTSIVANPDPQREIAYFAFLPVTRVAGARLTVRLTAPGAVDATMVSADVVRSPGPSVDRLRVSGKELDATLPLRLRFGDREPMLEQAPRVVDRISQYRPVPFKGLGLAVLGVLALAGALAVPVIISVIDGP